MPRPRSPSYALYVRLSDRAAEEIRQRAESAGTESRLLVERVIALYLDRVMDGQKPIHLHAMPDELKIRKFKLSVELGERLESIRANTGLAVQDIARAALTEHLHVL